MSIQENSIVAVLPQSPVSNGRRLDNKALATGYQLVAHEGVGFKEIVTAFVWLGKSSNASRVFAAIWVQGDDSKNRPWLSGQGSAGGWGYHKGSAAIDEAIRSAGVKLYGTPYGRSTGDFDKETSIHGVGDTGIELALYAIGQACGYSLNQLHLVKISG